MIRAGVDIEYALNELIKGNLIALPTETVYGLAANAHLPAAVENVFKAKRRPAYDPLILHFSSLERVTDYGIKIPGKLHQYAEKLWPGPLTLLVNRPKTISTQITSGLDRVAVRVPAHELTSKLLDKCNFPVVAPSANLFGKPSPTRPEHINPELAPYCTYILDGGSCKTGLESTILGIEDNQIIVYRKGSYTIEFLEELIDTKLKVREKSSSNPQAPGMLDKHYAPGKPVVVVDVSTFAPLSTDFILGFGPSLAFERAKHKAQFSSTFNLEEAAHKYFDLLRKADKHPETTRIILTYFPEEGLGRALNDKIRRAVSV